MKEPGASRRGVFSEEEKAAIRFAEELTAWPGAIHQEDLDGLSNYYNAEQITELVLTIAAANFTNRFNEGLQTPVDV